jgi:hypothetical protein
MVSSSVRRSVVAGLAFAFVLALPIPASRAQQAGCDALFPGREWTGTAAAGPVVVYGADMRIEELDRFTAEIDQFVALIQPEIGHLDGVSVCLFGGTVPLDPTAYVPLGQRVHALALTGEQVVVVEALDARLVQRAAGFGLAYLALWNLGAGPYPEPLAYAVGQWYVSRVEDKVELHHEVMSRVAFFQGTLGTDWTADVQSPTYAWNPQFQESPIGDLIDYAVEARGIETIVDPASVDWPALEARWAVDIEQELLGRSSPTTGWIFGLAFFLGMITLAVAMALIARRNKRIRHGPKRTDLEVVG